MAVKQRFIRTASVTLSAAGYGFCTITCPNGVTWEVDFASVSTAVLVTPTVLQPTCTLYQDSAPNPSKYLESTYSGDRNSSDSKYVLMGGESLTAEWANGALPIHAGALATLTLRGYQTQTQAWF